MPLPDRFADIPRTLQTARAVGAVLDAWMNEYLAALERQETGLVAGQRARPAKAKIRHAGILRPGEQTPAVVVWPEGILDQRQEPDGCLYGTQEIGVLLVAGGPNEDATTDLAHFYADAARAVLLHRPVELPRAEGTALRRVISQDEDYTAIAVDKQGRVRAGITLSYHAPNVYLGRRDGGPPPDAVPREDPSGPWPAGPTIQTATVDVVPTNDPLA